VRRLLLSFCTVLACAVFAAGCGGGEEQADDAQSGPRATNLREELGEATDPSQVDFPAVDGRSLRELADSIELTGPQAALATSVFRPGDNRFAFGLIDQKTGFVYGPSAVYFADKPGAPAQGPFPAPADLLVTEAPFRSRQAASEEDIFSAIYATELKLERTGSESLLIVTELEDGFVAAGTAIDVQSKAKDVIPDVGESAPRTSTETLDSARGDLESIETRLPPDTMHSTDYADVVGRKPVAVIFATPQLCESRVCGPVTDIAEQMKAEYGDEMEFIHQEVFVDNDPSKGLRKPLLDFNLRSEPWLFVMDAEGRVAARLEGSFGLSAFEAAVRKGLDGA
jgi:hypothetical protein